MLKGSWAALHYHADHPPKIKMEGIWLTPEQLPGIGNHGVSLIHDAEKAVVWMAGIVLYHMLFGCHPFQVPPRMPVSGCLAFCASPSFSIRLSWPLRTGAVLKLYSCISWTSPQQALLQQETPTVQTMGNLHDIRTQQIIPKIHYAKLRIPESPKISMEARDLLNKMLVANAKQRLDVTSILCHQYFSATASELHISQGSSNVRSASS